MSLRLIRAIAITIFTWIAMFNAGSANADIALDVIDQGSVGFNGNWTLGYEFTANDDLIVSQLGFFDRDQDGLAQSHAVGIWDVAGNLLVSGTVNPSDPLTGFFRYSSVSSITLSAGQNYVIGSYDFTPDDAVRSDLGGIVLTTSPDISIVTGRWRGGGTIRFPTNTINSSVFYPTATFQYTRASAIPEPSQCFGLCVLVVTCVRRRRFRDNS